MIDTILAPREAIVIGAPWAIPVAEPLTNLRIYAVIDPDNEVTNEVHENNNLGWAPAIALGLPTGVQTTEELPHEFTLYQSYPNPFNPIATIRFELPYSTKVSLKVFDMLGQEIETLIDEFKNAGNYSVQFSGSRLASGIYFYQLKTEAFIETKKMVLMK